MKSVSARAYPRVMPGLTLQVRKVGFNLGYRRVLTNLNRHMSNCLQNLMPLYNIPTQLHHVSLELRLQHS